MTRHVPDDLSLASQRPSRFYYGWVMVGVTVIGGLSLAPGQSYAIGEFKHALSTDLGLGESMLSSLYGIATFIAGFMALFAGVAMDRFGLRRAITVSVLLLGASCFFASRVTGPVSVFFAFLLLRTFGHSVLPLMTGTTLAMWFRRRLGFVNGLAGVLVTTMAAGIPPLYIALIAANGWRQAWVILGIGTCVVMLPVMWLLFRNHPEDVGQHIDGAAGDTPNDRRHADATADVAFDLTAARRTRAYWCLIALHSVHGMVFAAVMFHRVQIFEDRGHTVGQAATMFAIFSLCAAAMQFFGGFMADRLPLRLLLACTSFCTALALLILGGGNGIAGAYLFGALYGLGTGTEIVGRNTAWPRFFGTAHIGKIKSRGGMAAVLGSSVGPIIAGASFDQFDSFAPAVILLAALYCGIGAAMLFATTAQPSPLKSP